MTTSRRDFLRTAAGAVGVLASTGIGGSLSALVPLRRGTAPKRVVVIGAGLGLNSHPLDFVCLQAADVSVVSRRTLQLSRALFGH